MLPNLRNKLKNVRDPSMAGRIREGFAKELDALFVQFKSDAHKVIGVREMATPDPLAVKVVDMKLKRTIDATILMPGARTVKTNATKAYRAGGTRGTQFVNAIGIKFTFSQTPTDQKVIEILEDRDLSALKGITDDMSKDIMRKISDDVLKGYGIEKIARDIDESVDDIGRTRARLMARTETMYAFNTAARTQYEKLGITEVEWFTSHLENVCDECDALDGQKFGIGSAPDIPAHPNCPCILLPVMPEWYGKSIFEE